MGTKFRHTHVRSADAAAVADALCERALAHKFRLAAEGESCDHDVVVATNSGSPEWTSIYNRFGSFAWELSERLTAYVVELEIFDSDVLYARLSSDGCKVDVFCSRSGYTDEPARAVKGQPKRWDSLCEPGKSWREVQRVFKRALDDPEPALVGLGALIGLDARSWIRRRSIRVERTRADCAFETRRRRNAGSSRARRSRSWTREASCCCRRARALEGWEPSSEARAEARTVSRSL